MDKVKAKESRMVMVRLRLSGAVLQMPRSDADRYVRDRLGEIVRETTQVAQRQTRTGRANA